MTTVRVLIAQGLPEAYDYSVPEGVMVAPGDYVEVPLGRRPAIGVVWGEGSGTIDPSRLKPITRCFDVPPLPEVSRQFVDWVAQYYVASAGAVLRMVVSIPQALDPPSARMTARCKSIPSEPAPAAVPVFSPAQQKAVDVLTRCEDARTFSATLLDGVTGSGKTEVFLEAVAHTLSQGRQALVLLPEIALSSQVIDRFTRRFGIAPTVWHSDLTPAQRRTAWRAIAKGEVRVVIGARSALFLPFSDLGLIVVDEEHDGSYKQDDGVHYHARDMAVVRAHLGHIPVVLVSATPSLETMANVDSGKYVQVHLPYRHGAAVMPEVRLLDLRKEKLPLRQWLAPTLCTAIDETLRAGEQALLFLNRRGYAPLTLCRTCGHRLQCPQCTAWLVEHRSTHRLHCHHCGHGENMPPRCRACEAEDTLTACGPGVERIAEEVSRRFPQARCLLMASDLLTTAKSVEQALNQIRAKEVDIIVGTQIVAKGHHFPALTLVGVIDADLGLSGGDLRAAEKTFQLLQQVAGRAGRGEKPGRVFLQTYQPDHPVMKALQANDRDSFLARESDERRAHDMPPYGRLVALIVSSADVDSVDKVAAGLGRAAPRSSGVTVLGPAPAPLSMVRGRHRRRLLLKAPRGVSVQSVIKEWLDKVPVPRSVKVQVDVDPYGFL